MAQAGTAYVDIEGRTDDLQSQILDALANIDATVAPEVDPAGITDDLDAAISSVDGTVDVEAVADTAAAQTEIDALDGGSTEIDVQADTAAAQANIDDLSGAVGGLADQAGLGGGMVGGLADDLAGLSGASSAATVGIGALVGGLIMSLDAAGESQAVNAQFDQVLANMGDTATVSGDHVRGLATDIMEYSGFSDEAVLSGATLLATFDNIANSPALFDRTLKDSADLARFMGTDVPNAARLLARAVNDPEQGVARLARVFPSLTSAEREAIAAMAEAGDIAGAQERIFELVESRVGGVAAAYGETLPGAMDRAGEATGELAETVGADLVPALTGAIEDTTEWVTAMTDAKDQVAGLAGGLMGDVQGVLLEGGLKSLPIIGPVVSAVDALRGAFGGAESEGKALGDALGTTNPALDDTAGAADEAAAALSDFSQEIDEYLSGLFDVPSAQRELRQSFNDLSEAMVSGTWDDQAVAIEDLLNEHGDLIESLQRQEATQAELDTAVYGSIASLAQMRDEGKITQGMFEELSGEILGLPHQAVIPTSAPGATQATEQIKNVGEAQGKIEPLTIAGVQARGAAQAYDDVTRVKRQLEAIDGKTYTSYVGVVTSGSAAISTHKRAAGGPVSAGETYLVGEEGRELFTPDSDGFIIPNHALVAVTDAGAFAGSGGRPVGGRPVNINFNGPVIGTNPESLARYLAPAMTEQLRDLDRSGR